MEIKIISMDIRNFKGVCNLSIAFSQCTKIEGPNHSGKTTIADAFFWVLFHKDSQGRGQFGIKTLDADGNEIHRLEHEVALTLAVDERIVKFRKTYHEDWVKPKGKTQEELKGHSIDYSVDDVPCGLRDYDNKVREIIDESKFRMLTDVLCFSNLPWKEQKSILRNLAGEVNLNASGKLDDPRFAKLIAFLNNGNSLEEYDRYVRAQEKTIKERLERIPSEIEGKQETIVEVDLAALDENIKNLELQKASLKDKLNKVNENIESVNARSNTFIQKRQELLTKKSECCDRLNAIRASFNQSNMKVYEDEMHKYQLYKQDVIAAQTKRANLANEIKALRIIEKSCGDDIARIGDDWRKEKALEWSGSLLCPTCGQPLPDENVAEAKARFAENKQKNMDAIVAHGNRKRAELNECKEKIEAIQKELDAIKDPEPMEEPVLRQAGNVEDDIDYKMELEKSNDIQKELDAMTFTDSNESYKQERNGLNEQIDEIDRQLRNLATTKGRDMVNKTTLGQIKKLEEEMEAQNIALAEWEREEQTVMLYKQNEIDAIESAVNSKFTLVKFRFYKPLVNGGYDETCECTMHGTPYAILSTSEKVNAGIDIINALQKYNQCIAPILADNAEGVTQFHQTPAQMVRFYVREIPELKVSNDLF